MEGSTAGASLDFALLHGYQAIGSRLPGGSRSANGEVKMSDGSRPSNRHDAVRA